MTGQGPRKSVGDEHWAGRLQQAREFREVLGNNLPDRQEKFYRRLLGRKDEVNYGARSSSLDEAKRLLSALDVFVDWAEGIL